MIKSFKHKDLKVFFITGNKSGIISNHATKLARILDRLDSSTNPKDMNLPSYRLHELKGNEKGVWSVTVNSNWRLTFLFEDVNVILVDYRNYH